MLGHDGCLETVDTWVQEIYLSFVAMSVGWNRIPRNDACLQSAGFQISTSALAATQRHCCRWVTYLTDTGGPTLIFNQTTPDGLSLSLTLCRSRSLRRAGPGPAIPPPPPNLPRPITAIRFCEISTSQTRDEKGPSCFIPRCWGGYWVIFSACSDVHLAASRADASSCMLCILGNAECMILYFDRNCPRLPRINGRNCVVAFEDTKMSTVPSCGFSVA